MIRLIACTLASLLATSSIFAADLGTGSQCVQSGPARLSGIDNNAELTGEVVVLMTEAVNVWESDEWIDSTAPAFTWASEAKVACGKAYGYLQTGYRDDDTINKCECFHGRMRQSMY